MQEEEKKVEETKEEQQEQNSEMAPSATFLNSLVVSVRLADQSLRHVQFSIFEDDENHQVRVFYDVIDPRNVSFKK